MPRFISNSGSFQDLIVTGSRLYVASSSIFFNNLVTSSTALSNVLVISSSGQIYFTASSALPSSTQTVPTPTFIATGSVSASVNVGPTSFQITSGSNTFMLVTSESRVGIGGIISPNSTLHVSSSFRVTGGTGKGQLLVESDDSVQIGPSVGTAQIAKLNIYGGTNLGSYIYFGYNSAYAGEIASPAAGRIHINPSTDLLFLIGGAETARINNNGNLLIGTTADHGRLVVSGSTVLSGSLNTTGSVLFRGLTTSNESSVVTINTSTGQLYYTASSAFGGGGSSTPTSFIATGSVTASVNVTTSSIFQITSGSSTFMIINNSGSVGINVSNPNVYGVIYSGSVGLQVKDKLAVFHGDGTGSGILITGNSGGRTYMTKDGSAFVAYQDNISSVAKKWLQVNNAIDDNTPILALQDSIAGNGKYTKWTINASSSYDYNTTFAIRQYSTNHTYTFGIFDTTNNRSFSVKPNGDGYFSGSLFIGTGSVDRGYKLMVSGSDISGSFNANNILFVSGSNVGIGSTSIPNYKLVISGSGTTGSLFISSPNFANSTNNLYQVGTLIQQGGITATGTNQTFDMFSVGQNLTSSGVNNNTYFFRVNYNGGNSTGNYGASGDNVSLMQLNAPTISKLLLTAQNQGMLLYGQTGGAATITTITQGANLFLRSDLETGNSGGGIHYYASENGINFGHRWFQNNAEKMRLSQLGNLTIGYTGSLHPTESFYKLAITGSSTSGSLNVNNVLYVSGSTVTITGSTNVLKVIGSGSIPPLFTVQGSQGELFTVTDSLSGSLFSVNDISGLPILDVNSDQTTKIGSYLAPGMYTSTKVTANTGVTVIYSIPTASYDSAYFDYNIRSGSVGRAGQIMAMWSGSSVNYSEVSASSFGTTNTFVFGVSISGSNMILSGSAPTNGWTVKTIVKAI